MDNKNHPKLPSPQERLELILLGLARGQPVDLLCQQAGVSRELFYRWMKRVKSSALQALEAKKPGPKRVKNVEQATRKIHRMEERLARLEQEAAVLRKERDHLEQVNQVARRIIRRQAAQEPQAPVKKNAMRTKPPTGSIASNGTPSESSGQRCGPSATPGASTAPPTGDGSGGRSGPSLPNDEGGSKKP